eukprot:2362914-Rhodomonas_salina.4
MQVGILYFSTHDVFEYLSNAHVSNVRSPNLREPHVAQLLEKNKRKNSGLSEEFTTSRYKRCRHILEGKECRQHATVTPMAVDDENSSKEVRAEPKQNRAKQEVGDCFSSHESSSERSTLFHVPTIVKSLGDAGRALLGICKKSHKPAKFSRIRQDLVQARTERVPNLATVCARPGSRRSECL